MSKFTELTVYTTHEGGDIISALLWDYTDAGVVIYDVEDVIELDRSGKNWDYADDTVFSQDKTVLVKAYFPVESANEQIKKIEEELYQMKGDSLFGTLETVKREVDGDLWREKWKEHFKPLPIGRVVIVPEWIKYQKKEDEIIVLLDSNMAFGTGEHETTSMCVEMLEKFVKTSDTVLDVGCGSGILGIVASKLGAKEVIMTDIDECAVESAEHNCKLNEVSNGKVFLKNLLDDNTVKGEVIVCNIIAEVLMAFAPHIANNLKPNGTIILSGILKDRLDKVRKTYEENGFRYVESKTKGEWSCLVLKGNVQ